MPFNVFMILIGILYIFIRTWAILMIHVPLQNDVIIGGDGNLVLNNKKLRLI